MKNFKPNLIPNNPKDGSFDIHKKIEENGGYLEYMYSLKKDGCRLESLDELLTRSMKKPKSKLVVERFQPLVDLCKELNISLEGEFYMHGLKFNEILRFFSKSDVTNPEYKTKLEKELAKNPEKFAKDYEEKDIEFLTTFQEDLKFWMFDGIVLDRPDLVGYEDRMNEIKNRLQGCGTFVFGDASKYFVAPLFMGKISNKEELNELYRYALDKGFEGLVLTHKKHEYKFGRNTLKQGTLLKMKDDAIEYDGVILDVLEATMVKDGVEKTTNELGRSVTSKKKGDREESGLAKGFLVQFENIGTFPVSLKGFDNDQKRELLENKSEYIGRHFKYTAMLPVKNFPRHAYFAGWRDEK